MDWPGQVEELPGLSFHFNHCLSVQPLTGHDQTFVNVKSTGERKKILMLKDLEPRTNSGTMMDTWYTQSLTQWHTSHFCSAFVGVWSAIDSYSQPGENPPMLSLTLGVAVQAAPQLKRWESTVIPMRTIPAPQVILLAMYLYPFLFNWIGDIHCLFCCPPFNVYFAVDQGQG